MNMAPFKSQKQELFNIIQEFLINISFHHSEKLF